MYSKQLKAVPLQVCGMGDGLNYLTETVLLTACGRTWDHNHMITYLLY